MEILELRRISNGFDECVSRGTILDLEAWMKDVISRNTLEVLEDTIRASNGDLVRRYFTKSPYGTRKLYYITLEKKEV